MILNVKQALDQIKQNDYVIAYIIDGHVFNDDTRPMQTIKCESSDVLCEKIKTFSEVYPDKFMLLTATGKSATMKGSHHLLVNFAQKGEKGIVDKPLGNPQLSIAEVNDQVAIALKAQQQRLEKENELLRVKRDLQEMQTSGGKLAYAIEQLLTRIFMTPKTVLQGTDEKIQAEVDVDMKELLKKAVAVLREGFGDEDLIRIADKIQKNPNLVPTIKKMLL